MPGIEREGFDEELFGFQEIALAGAPSGPC